MMASSEVEGDGGGWWTTLARWLGPQDVVAADVVGAVVVAGSMAAAEAAGAAARFSGGRAGWTEAKVAGARRSGRLALRVWTAAATLSGRCCASSRAPSPRSRIGRISMATSSDSTMAPFPPYS
ncbi:hypothetical protein ISCGN_023870 [Ixodes scapularis]